MPKRTKTITLSLSPELYDKILQEGMAVNRRPPSYLRQMIHLYYQHLEQSPKCEKSLKVQ